MGMTCFGKSLAGAGYVVLNVIRVVNIISLLAVIVASSVMLVKTFIVSKFFFFDACAHVIAIVVSGFLIITELPLFKAYFARNWPLFSHKSGFVMLGFAMILLGNGLLGNLNKEATSQKSLGLPFWRVVISAGCIVITMGAVNLLAASPPIHNYCTDIDPSQSFVFRDSKIGLSARQVRSHGAVAEHKVANAKSGRRSFHLGKRDSLPSYYSRSTNSRSEATETPRSKMEISSPISNDPEQFAKFSNTPEVTVPNLAHHPAMFSERV